MARAFDVRFAEESQAGQEEMIDQNRDLIRRTIAGLGFTVSEDRLFELGRQATRLGMDEYEINELITIEQGFDPGRFQSMAKQMAGRYYLPIDDDAATEYGTKLFTGELDQYALEEMFRQQAKGRFPSLAELIDSGVTPETYFAPYKSQIAQLLEIPSGSIDLLNDTRFSTIIDYMPDAGGTARPMTLNEMQRYVRQLDDWQYTDNAKDSASRLAAAIGARFGRTT